MSDLFHEDVPMGFVMQVFAVMAVSQHHTFQILTKRAERMHMMLNTDGVREWCKDSANMILAGLPRRTLAKQDASRLSWDLPGWPLPNVWLGVSAEDQHRVDERVHRLLQTPASVRFLSYEPALGDIDLTSVKCVGAGEMNALTGRLDDTDACSDCLDWVIAGGESGPKARPSNPAWFRFVRDQCRAFGVPFFFKQWGEWGVMDTVPTVAGGGEEYVWGNGEAMLKVGKRWAGRELDGEEHMEYPA